MTTNDLLRKRFAELRAEEAAIKAKTADLHEKREAANQRAITAQAAARELTAKIHAIERPQLLEVKAELSRIATALGAKALSDL